MCGRFALAYVRGFLTRFQVIDASAKPEPRYNIAPTQNVPIIVRESRNQLVMMRWGLIPFWAKDPKIGNRMINARAETVATSPAFRASFKHRRCLVPVTGFYEWKKAGKAKTPYYAHMKDDRFFSLAGLYDDWASPEGKPVTSFTIVTTVPNRLLGKIHNRMPVILARENEDLWLEGRPLESEEATRLFRPFPARMMETYEVSRAVNNPGNDSDDLVAKI